MEGYELKNYLYIDIETKSHGEPDFESLKTLKEIQGEYPTRKELEKQVPKTYQKDEKKSKDWVEKNYKANLEKAQQAYDKQVEDYDKEFRKKALNSLESDLVCIGLAYNEGEPVVVKYNENEAHMLEEMLAWIEMEVGERDKYSVTLVAHNISFDLIRIWHRVVKYQIKDLMMLLPIGKFDKRREDTNDLFNAHFYGKYTSLDDMCRFLDLPGKGDVDGSKVHDLFLEGKLDVIEDYCMNGDVRKLRMAHRKLKGLPQLDSDIENVK